VTRTVTTDHPIILYDGVCNLCDATVRFVLSHEREPDARFASLQSDVARDLLERHDLPADRLDTVVVIDDEGAHTRSEAALRIARLLRAPWSWARALRIVPRPIRDWLYDRVASSRYRLFGTKDICDLPSLDSRDRFLDLNRTPSGKPSNPNPDREGGDTPAHP